jgi:hypothetical protein
LVTISTHPIHNISVGDAEVIIDDDANISPFERIIGVRVGELVN